MSDFFIRGQQYSLNEIKNLTQDDFTTLRMQSMPVSLYKYFPNTTDPETRRNYSQDALQNNTVFLQLPTKFDDPYDCTILLDEHEFVFERIKYYAWLCGIDVFPSWDYSRIVYELSSYLYRELTEEKETRHLFPNISSKKAKFALQNELFILRVKIGLKKFSQLDNAWGQAFYDALQQEYVDFHEETIMKFRVSCFGESPYSLLMWAHYANNHQGFCVEYEVPPYTAPFTDILNNLMPVIYGNQRFSVLDQCVRSLQPPGLTQEILWDIYKYGLLMKSIDWKYQNEWRLISCDNMLSDNNYNCHFFKIKKVYLGNKMNIQDRKAIIATCKKMQIPYTGVIVASDRYEMVNCSQLCEKCPRLENDSAEDIS